MAVTDIPRRVGAAIRYRALWVRTRIPRGRRLAAGVVLTIRFGLLAAAGVALAVAGFEVSRVAGLVVVAVELAALALLLGPDRPPPR